MADIGLVLDCVDGERLAEFWAAALGYSRRGGAGQYIMLMPEVEGGGPKLLLQQVAEPRAAKNRMHMDVHVSDIEAEATRLEALGAAREAEGRLAEFGAEWIRMTDPEGNEFCVCRL